MAKRVNKNLVIVLAALGFAVTTVAGVVMVRLAQQKDPEEFVRKADELAEREEWERAGIFYKRAYQVSENAAYLVRAADMLCEEGKEPEALSLYQNAVVVDPLLLEAQEKILDLQLEIAGMQSRSTQAWRNVRATAETILKLPGQELHARAQYGLGAALLGLKEQAPENEALGVENLQKAVEIAPEKVEPVRRLVQYYGVKGRFEEAEQLLHDLVERNQTPGMDAAEARCLYASYQTNREENTEEAIKLYDEALTFAGDDPEAQALVHVRKGRFWFERWQRKKQRAASAGDSARPTDAEIDQDFNAAAESFRRAIEVAPEEFDGYRLLAELHRFNGEIDKAIEVYEKRLELPFHRQGFKSYVTRVNRYTILVGLANLYITLAAEEEDTQRRDSLTATANMHIEDAFGELPTGADASHMRGKLNYVLGKYREATKWFEQAAQRSGSINPVNLHYLARARLNLGELGAAREAILKAISARSASASCWVTLARILLQMDEPHDAINAANQILAVFPDQREALLIKAAAQERLGQKETAGNTIAQIQGAFPALVAAQGQILAQQGREKEGLEKVLAALKENPVDPDLIRAAVGLYKKMGREDEAKKTVEAALARKPGSFDLKLIALSLGDWSPEERRERYLTMIGEIDDSYRRAMRLASFYAQDGDQERLYEQLVVAKDLIIKGATPSARDAGENMLRALIDRLLRLAFEAKDLAKLDALVKEAADLNLDAADGLSYRGRRLLIDAEMALSDALVAAEEGREEDAERHRKEAERKYGEAVEVLELALEEYPSSSDTYAQLGEAYLRIRRNDEARIAFERSNEIMPRNGLVLKRLAYLSTLAGNDNEYKDWLAQCRMVIPDDPWVVDQLLEMEEKENPREGIARREKLREENPDDYGNLLRLATLYQAAGDVTNAAKCVDDMLRVEYGLASVAKAAEVLRSLHKPERALELLKKYVREAPPKDKAPAQLLIGEHYDALGDRAADAAFLAAADIDANLRVCVAIGRHYSSTGRFAEADEWFVKAYKLAEESGSVAKASVLQLRIETLIRLDRMKEARALCDAYLADYPDRPMGLYLDAEVARGLGEIEQAIDKLTLYLEKRPGDPMGVYRRAQYQVNLGRAQHAVSDLESLRASNPTCLNFAPRILLASAYEKVGRTDMAFQELEGIYREHPEATYVVNELIDMYMDRRRYAQADKVLTTLLSKDPQNVRWLVRSGEVALEQHDRSKALANLRQAVKLSGYHPSVTTKLFDAYLKLKVVEPAITFYEKSVPPDRRTPTIMLSYASLLAERGDTTDAVSTFRVALQRQGFGTFTFLSRLGNTLVSAFGGEAKALELFRQKPANELFERANRHILIILLLSSGQMDEALVLCRDLLETATDPGEKAAVLLYMAQAHDGADDAPKAKEAFEQVLAIDEDNLIALNDLAFLLTDKLDAPELAIPYAKRAARISEDPAVTDTLGWAYLRSGRFRDAVAQLSRARQRDPDYIPASYHLGEACRRDGQFENAIKLFNEVVEFLNEHPGHAYEEYRALAEEGLRRANAQEAG